MKEVDQSNINSAPGLNATDEEGRKVRLKDVAAQTYDAILALKPIMLDQVEATQALLGATKNLKSAIVQNNELLQKSIDQNAQLLTELSKHREVMQTESNPALKELAAKLVPNG